MSNAPIVALARCTRYEEVEQAIRALFDHLGGPERFLSRGEPLLLKPNLLAARPVEQGVTTHPAVIEATLAIAREHGARPVIGDSPGVGSARRVARACGIEEVAKRFDVPIVTLGAAGVRRVKGATFRELELAAEAVDTGHLWNLPRWKTHTMMGLTLGVKNLYGCLPGRRKVQGHMRAGHDAMAFAALVLDIAAAIRPGLTILDGVRAMDKAGPSRGRLIDRHLLLASADPHALDWVAAELSAFAPEMVPTLALALKRGLIDPDRIERRGEPAAPKRFRPAPGSPADFEVIPRPLKALLRGALSPAPRFVKEDCTACGVCVEACPANALILENPPILEDKRCIRCYCCQELCPQGAVKVPGFLRAISFGR